MKFAAVVVLFALAIGAHSSIVPLTYTALNGPAFVYAHHEPASVAVHASPYAAHVPVVAAAAPAPLVQAGPAPFVHAAPVVHAGPAVVVPAEGTYVAKTRGSVHIASLPGHANSASSVNLEPAPGTL